MRLLRMLRTLVMPSGFVVFGGGAMRLGCILMMFRGLLVLFVCHKVPLFAI